MNAIDKIRESNRIERITRDPTPEEIAEYERFMNLTTVSVAELERFVDIYQPGMRLRENPGQDVRIGSYYPPEGGPHIRTKLQALLDDVNRGRVMPFKAHVRYEKLHPFMDGNGRSGRMLWYWQMEANGYDTSLGFLHLFYYQSLESQQYVTPT